MHYDGWFWDHKTQDFYRWKDLPNNAQGYWAHYCTEDKTTLALKEAEACPYCKKVLDTDAHL